jgi:hypothetical protein
LQEGYIGLFRTIYDIIIKLNQHKNNQELHQIIKNYLLNNPDWKPDYLNNLIQSYLNK